MLLFHQCFVRIVKYREKKEGAVAHQQWKCTHKCHINHKGSSGSMEAACAIEIFGSSITKYNLHYSTYLGDGDTVFLHHGCGVSTI